MYHLGRSLAIIAPLTLIQVPSMSQTIPEEQDAFLEYPFFFFGNIILIVPPYSFITPRYSVKIANFNDFRKTATKVIKSARKLADNEAERLHEYSVFADNLINLQTTYEYSISPELGGALGGYASLWKRLGDLRSEMVNAPSTFSSYQFLRRFSTHAKRSHSLLL